MNNINSTSNHMPLRIGILMDHPSPHMVALLDAIAERQDCIATVVYFGKSAPERTWGAPTGSLPFRFLKGITLSGGFRINASLPHLLGRMRVDAWVVNSIYSSPSTLAAAWWLNHDSKPWVYMNEPPRPRYSTISSLKYLFLEFVLQRAWGVIGMGHKAEEMYRIFLMHHQSTTSIPYYIDLEDFLRLPLPSAPEEEQAVKFVTSGQMIRRKGLDILLRACELLPDKKWELTLAGDGPLRNLLEKEFAKRWDNERVRFIGEVPYEKRSSIFDGKHVFVFPSRWDGWGMVVPEALAAGIPVISTDQVISAHEFIRNGENGFIVPTEDPQSLANSMKWFVQNKVSIQAMGIAARQSLEDYRPEVGAERLVQFLLNLVGNQQKVYTKIMDSSTSNLLNWKNLRDSSLWHRRWKNNLCDLAKKIFINSAIAVKQRNIMNGHRILVYHLVLKEDRKRFEDHIKFLADNFKICSVAEVFRAINNLPNNTTYSVAITFDDGFRLLMYDCLEVLEKFDVKACFHVPTGFVTLSKDPEKAVRYCLRTYYYNLPLDPMRPDDLKMLVDLGHEIGSHGISHISLATMTKPMAEKELNLSRKKIYEWTGKEPVSFAYPYGEIQNPLGKTTDWVREAGYKFALTLRRGKIDESTDPFLIPREHIEGNWPINYLKYFLFS